MADKKVTDLALIDAVQPTDIVMVIDDPSGTPINKKATVTQLLASGSSHLDYLGDYVSGTYNDGDIVVGADGIAYMCVKNGTTTPPEVWPGTGIATAVGPPGPTGATGPTGPPGADGTGGGGPHHTTHEPGGTDMITVLALGTTPATTGLLRLANNGAIMARKADNSADIRLLTLDASNTVQLAQGLTNVYVCDGGVTLSGLALAGGAGAVGIYSNPAYNDGITGYPLNLGWFGSDARIISGSNRLVLQSANLIVIAPQGGAIGSPWWFDNVAFYPAGTTNTQDIGTTSAWIRNLYATTVRTSAIKNAGDIQFESAAGAGDRTYISCLADGQITLYDHNASTFGLLQFGGRGSSHPALKRSSTGLAVRLANDSADAPFSAGTTTVNGDLYVTGDVIPITQAQLAKIDLLEGRSVANPGDTSGSRTLLSQSYVSGLSLRHDQAVGLAKVTVGDYDQQIYQPLTFQSLSFQVATGTGPGTLVEHFRVQVSGGVTVGTDHSVDPGVSAVLLQGPTAKLMIQPSQRSYSISADDPAGTMLFGRSDAESAFIVSYMNANQTGGVPRVLLGTSNNGDFSMALNGGVITLCAGVGGGARQIQFGRRVQDNSPGVGATVEFWTCTNQSVPAITVLAPGGASSVMSVQPDGTITATGLGTTPLDATKLTGTIPDARLSANVLKFTGGYPGGTTTFLRADGTFAAPAGGTVTAHAASHRSVGSDPVDVKTLAGFPGDSVLFLNGMGTFSAPTVSMANVALLNQANVFTANQLVTKIRPEVQLQTPGDTTKARFASVVPGGRIDLSTNAFYTGTAWMRDDTTKSAGLVTLFETGQFGVWRAVAGGTDPFTLLASFIVDKDGHFSVAGRLQIGLAGAGSPSYPAWRNTGAQMECVLGDNSNWASVQANFFYSIATGNNLGDLTVRGGTNFQGGINGSGNLSWTGNIINAGYVYPGRVDVGGSPAQTSWMLGSHGSFGLYTNAGLYIAGTLTVAGSVNGTLDMATNILDRAKLRNYSEVFNAAYVAGNGYVYCDLSVGNHFYVVYNAPCTFVIRSAPPGVSMMVIAIIGQGANYGIGWYGSESNASGVRWQDGVAPQVKFGVNRWDFYTLYSHDGGTTWWGFQSGQNM